MVGLLSGGILVGLLYMKENNIFDSQLGAYLVIGFFGFIFSLGILGTILCIFFIISSFKGIEITLDVNGIKIIKIFRFLCCRNEKIFGVGEIKRFDIKIFEKINEINKNKNEKKNEKKE